MVPDVRKVGLAKAAGAEVALPRTGEKWHAAVAKSTFASQNAQNTTFPEPFWKLRCSKIARRCGAKHICKAKCTKHHDPRPILDVPMFKNGTPLWREAYLSLEMHKTHHRGGAILEVPMFKNGNAAVARSIFVSQNVENTTLSGPALLVVQYVQKWHAGCGEKHICKAKCAKHLRFAAFREVSN